MTPSCAAQRLDLPADRQQSPLTSDLTSVSEGQRVLLVYDDDWTADVLAAQAALHSTASSLETRLFAGGEAERRHLASRLLQRYDVCLLLLNASSWSDMPTYRPPHTLWTRLCSRLVVVVPPERPSSIPRLVREQFSFTSRPLLLLAADGKTPAWRPLVTDCARRQAQYGVSKTTANFNDQKLSLRGMELRVTSTAAAATPFAWLKDDREVGVEVDLLDTIATNDGFSVRYVRPNDSSGLFGKVVNGSWTGVIGVLDRDQADLAIGDISDTLARRRAIDYVYPFHVEHIGFISHKPLPLPRWIVIVRPFDTPTWVLLFGSILLATVVFAFLPDVFPTPHGRIQS